MGSALMPSPVAVVGWIDKNAREKGRVALDEFRGARLVDIRVCVPLTAHTDALAPTRAGIALSINLLRDLRAALAKAESRAVDLGWLAPEGAAE
jgi:hypothetical protein